MIHGYPIRLVVILKGLIIFYTNEKADNLGVANRLRYFRNVLHFITILMTNHEAIMRGATQDILTKFAVTAYDWTGHLAQDVDLTFSQAILAVEMIIDLPVCWIDKDLQESHTDQYGIEGTLEYWEEILTELKSVQ